MPTREQLPDLEQLQAIPPLETLLAVPVSKCDPEPSRTAGFFGSRSNGRPTRSNSSATICNRSLMPASRSAAISARSAMAARPSIQPTRWSASPSPCRCNAGRRAARSGGQRPNCAKPNCASGRVADQIETELGNILANLGAALRLTDLAEAEVKQASQMVQARTHPVPAGCRRFSSSSICARKAPPTRKCAPSAPKLAGRLAEASLQRGNDES